MQYLNDEFYKNPGRHDKETIQKLKAHVFEHYPFVSDKVQKTGKYSLTLLLIY